MTGAGTQHFQFRVIVFQKTGKDQMAIPLYDDDTYTAQQILRAAAPHMKDKNVCPIETLNIHLLVFIALTIFCHLISSDSSAFRTTRR